MPESSNSSGAAAASSADPFTGGGRYVPGGPSNPATESQAKPQAPVSVSLRKQGIQMESIYRFIYFKLIVMCLLFVFCSHPTLISPVPNT